jgi:hypothetical protein
MKCDKKELIFTVLLAVAVFMCIFATRMAHAEDICVSEDSAKRLVVDLQEGQVNKETVAELKGLNAEMQKQVDILEATVALKDEEIKKDAEHIADQKQLMTYQDEACAEKVKNAKPGFFDTALRILGAVGVGILIGLLL